MSLTISNTITVPNTLGTYYYGACVDNLTGELQRANNCSSAVGIVVVAPTPNPDLIVINMMASRTNVDFSEEITLRATVRNAGASSSAATTLRWYRSTDSTITTADTPVGTSRLSSLGAGTSVTISNTITVPNSVGTYYYGACVDSVVDETEANNNCSSTVRVVVTDPSMHLPTSDFNTLNAAGNNVPRGIWSDGTTLWIADWGDTKLYAYNLATKAHVSTKDFTLAADNRDPSGIWSDTVTMWVADTSDDKLYAYSMSNQGPCSRQRLHPIRRQYRP